MKEKANNVQELSTPLEMLSDGEEGWQNVITSLIQQEVGKALKEKESGGSGDSDHMQIHANLVSFDHFTGRIVSQDNQSSMHNLEFRIIDSRASTYMCHNLSRFKDVESSKILVVAKAERGLYVLNEESFNCSSIQDPYSVCPLAKQQRLMFNKTSEYSNVLFDLIHIDLWGPYKVATRLDTRYFLTIVEDGSRSNWTMLLSNKMHVFNVVKSFFNMVKKQFNIDIKRIRTDNGSEFLSNDFQSFVSNLGVL
ncbi:hypothetical protein LIER_11764 [Lithospermum erythrorhizon]|uniref:Integrase catalytic domain-containing protein n=1 Tax=Lithospermum erythrorhizon TaxID=34254 RepID=A0AAV3PPA4_LITER